MLALSLVSILAIFIISLLHNSEKKEKFIKELKYEREIRKEQKERSYLRYFKRLQTLLDKRFNTLDSSEYTRVKYKLKGFDTSELKSLSLLPERLFFQEYYDMLEEPLQEFRRQVEVGRISEFTHDLLKYVSLCSYGAYPNGRYERWIPDEMICNGNYKLVKIKKNLLEG